jgi:KRAB domain-containing zinc finger protein
MKSADLEMRFKCPKCPKQYWTKYTLKAHMNISHEDVKRHQCYFCSYATFKNSDMIKHMSKHTKEKPYKCQYCFESFKKKQSVKSHKDGNSCSLKLKYLSLSPCYFCGEVFSNHLCLHVHMQKVHLKEDFTRCNPCCKDFASTGAFSHHIRTVHLLERNYKCQLCSKRLSSNSALNRHVQSAHTKEKPFKCYFCSKSFVNFEVLKIHMSIHTKEKPLTCYFCRKDFSVVRALSIHIGRIHTKERPFKCIQCPSLCYSSKGILNEHVRKKHFIEFIGE